MIEKSSSVHRVLKTHVITQLLRKCKVFLTKVLTVQEDNDIWLLLAVTSLSLVAQVKLMRASSSYWFGKSAIHDSKYIKFCLLQATGLCRFHLPYWSQISR